MKNHSRSINRYLGFLFGITLVGLALVGWGATIPSASYSLILSSVGGAIFGAGISLFLGDLIAKNALDEVRNVLSTSLDDGFCPRESALCSKENEIISYRAKWHHYHVTRMHDKYVWRYRIYDFSNSCSPGKLAAEIFAKDKQGREHKYIVKAGIRDGRFMIFEKAALGNEPVIIEIYPFMGLELQGIHSGIGTMRTWDGNNVLFPCIMSREPIINWKKEGDISEKLFADLDRIWKKDFTNLNAILPRVI
ncbi:hypothetical protein HNI00_04100 [Thermoleptolyngbya oregonensis NK1-22]|uniref:Uncharacterized protein n=1 Tax=Thermoleptolyngbya oregonensis NK1-22 TaxID=2547457 RepID=A0AA96YLL0_9CYAN|nr:hypothetical protein [Thermoleptolyngbya oregonensis]WOB42427.1 hypothetical protein HNI00_04100 [Thermoleptolyngbya oregonensis NK1-22]